MDKLEIKLTLTADSTPELLRYLRGISSARDRAFILKRLATSGLSTLNSGIGGDAILLPSPTSTKSTSPSAGDSAANLAPTLTPAPESAPTVVPLPPALGPTAVVASVPTTPPPLQRRQDVGPTAQAAPSSGFEFLDLDALNAATAQFV